jgi:hypothetical protein
MKATNDIAVRVLCAESPVDFRRRDVQAPSRRPATWDLSSFKASTTGSTWTGGPSPNQV